ncbi:MAG: hypothetical protein IKE73_00605 [Bacilli bacterium]|nr:hypothetical protein [Bacilli bacterium]
MKIFNDIRNFINDSSKIIIYDNLIDIINFKEIKDISSSSIKILSNKEINITGKDLCIIKMYDNEIVIKGIIKSINV